ncbi:MAG: chemotaxis protein CheX [Fibrobacter sp.]|nr:chemotaxis protein CheX [Fibrobacter sp.]
MKAEHINPFLKSTIDTFDTMLKKKAVPGKIFLRTKPHNADISGVIGLSGDIRGAVVMAYPKQTAINVVSAFLGEEVTDFDEDVSDAIGELTNIITGYAKRDLTDLDLSISLPSVIRGANHLVDMPKNAPVVCIPFDGDCGEFVIEVSMIGKE